MGLSGRTDFDTLYSEAPAIVKSAILALGAPVVLTDELAMAVCRIAGMPEDDSAALVASLHLTDFVVERNSEWHFSPDVRRALANTLRKEPEVHAAVHTLLLGVLNDSPLERSGGIPRYLQQSVGLAFHTTEIDPVAGLKRYAAAYKPILDGKQWLLGVLANEQQEYGVIAPDAIEPAFLRGMTLHLEGRMRDAEPYLRRVSGSAQIRVEVAIAQHVVGLYDLRRDGTAARGEALLRSSLDLGDLIGERVHQAHVLNSLGTFLAKRSDRHAEAEATLRRGVSIARAVKDPAIIAQLLHSLGRLLSGMKDKHEEAKKLLTESLDIESRLQDPRGRAQVLHSLGLLRAKRRQGSPLAVRDLRESLQILEAENDARGVAQVSFSLGRVLWGKARVEATELLMRSIELNRHLGLHEMERRVKTFLRTRVRRNR